MTKDNSLNPSPENKIDPKVPTTIDPYRQKILNFKKRIIFGVSTFGVLLVFIFSFNFYDRKTQDGDSEQIASMETQINDLRNRASGTEAKINDAKKFKRLWTNASDRKKNFNGIKVVEVTNDFNSLAEKNDISKPSITLSVPEVLKNGVYQLETLDVNLINCTITFEALTDRSALDFIDSFVNSLPGYVVMSDLSIKKSKKESYNEQELVDISNGKFPNLISGKATFSWHFLKRKPKQIKSPNNAT